jgi:hypothetical protein
VQSNGLLGITRACHRNERSSFTIVARHAWGPGRSGRLAWRRTGRQGSHSLSSSSACLVRGAVVTCSCWNWNRSAVLDFADTEEDGGSTPPAPTMPALSRAFVDLVVTPVDGICGRGRPSGRDSTYQGESRMLDSPDSVCARQAGSEYPATSVPFSNCLTQGVLFGEKPSPSAASRPPGADPDVDQGPTPPPDHDWPFRRLAGSRRRVGDRTDLVLSVSPSSTVLTSSACDDTHQ